MLNIEPIKLLAGSHSDTDKTGSGCFMNVIAYLNGEAQITDYSPCVCQIIRIFAIFLNDRLGNTERQRLIPFIQRAMGSRDDNFEVISKRLKSIGTLHSFLECEYPYFYRSYGFLVTSYAHKYFSSGHIGAISATREMVSAMGLITGPNGLKEFPSDLKEMCFQVMDEICPPADELDLRVIARAERLVELATA